MKKEKKHRLCVVAYYLKSAYFFYNVIHLRVTHVAGVE